MKGQFAFYFYASAALKVHNGQVTHEKVISHVSERHGSHYGETDFLQC